MVSEISTDNSLGFLLSDCQRLLSTVLDRQLREAGFPLSRSQWRVIAYLSRNDGITQTQLAELLDMERAPLGALVDKLETAGLVARQSDPSDRRVNRIFLTPRGTDTMPSVRAQVAELMPVITAGISDKEMDSLINSLNQLKQNLLTARERKGPTCNTRSLFPSALSQPLSDGPL